MSNTMVCTMGTTFLLAALLTMAELGQKRIDAQKQLQEQRLSLPIQERYNLEKVDRSIVVTEKVDFILLRCYRNQIELKNIPELAESSIPKEGEFYIIQNYSDDGVPPSPYRLLFKGGGEYANIHYYYKPK